MPVACPGSIHSFLINILSACKLFIFLKIRLLVKDKLSASLRRRKTPILF